MKLTDDATIYLGEFGSEIVSGNITSTGILDSPAEVIIDGMIMASDYTLTCPAADFGDLLYGAAVAVDGVDFIVKENKRQQDGLFCVLSLERVALPTATPEI